MRGVGGTRRKPLRSNAFDHNMCPAPSLDDGRQSVELQPCAAFEMGDIDVPTVLTAGEHEEDVLLGAGHAGTVAVRGQLDGDEGGRAAAAVEGERVGEHDAFIGDDVEELGAILDPLRDTGRGEGSAGDLVSANPEVQLVMGGRRVAGDAEPARAQ